VLMCPLVFEPLLAVCLLVIMLVVMRFSSSSFFFNYYFKSMAKIVFLNATYRVAVCTIVIVHVSITAIEVQVTCVRTTYGT
jgi:hypothetical protein